MKAPPPQCVSVFFSRGMVSLLQILVFHVFHPFALLLRHAVLRGMGCKTYKLVCTQLTDTCLTGRRAHWGYKHLILAMLWFGKCVEIICDSGQRVSCGRGGRAQLAHMSAPNRKKDNSMGDISCGLSC